MKKIGTTLVAIGLLSFGALTLVACGEKEKTPGEKLDGAIEDVKDAADDAKKDLEGK